MPQTITRALPVLACMCAGIAAVAIGSPPPDAPACPLFPRDNAWNQRVDRLPALHRSRAFLQHLGAGKRLFADFSMPYTTVGRSQRTVPVSFFYRRESDRERYPIPRDVPIEPGTPDRHVIVLDRDRCKLFELYKARRVAKGRRWRAGAGAIWNLRSNRLRPRGWTSADAAGLPILPGLARYDEVRHGLIDHALRFTAEGVRETYVYPARHSDGRSSSRTAPPMGTRLRLERSFDISGFPPQAKVVLRALKQYGMILADSGPAFSITGAPSPGWDRGDLASLSRVTGADLEVLDTRRLPKPGL